VQLPEIESKKNIQPIARSYQPRFLGDFSKQR
jgi:hypothetical protein